MQALCIWQEYFYIVVAISKIFIGFLFISCVAFGQAGYTIRTVAFYNLENLYDTIDDPAIRDEERTPKGRLSWTRKRYGNKINKLAAVIGSIGRKWRGRGPDLLGVCEVENHQVLDALIANPALTSANYKYIHFNSPDERGIDVALLYNAEVFIPVEFDKRPLKIYNEAGFRDYTRDQLIVMGYLDGEPLYVIINHWPSRSGGTLKTSGYRKEAALLTRKIMDSVRRDDPESKFIVMGDFNDNPTDISLEFVLRASSKRDSLVSGGLFNPMAKYLQKGYGTLAFRDHWNLFDQIILSDEFLEDSDQEFRYWKSGIYNPPELITQKGRYRGYPYRTYAGGKYQGGYSDHFPVYVYLIRRKE